MKKQANFKDIAMNMVVVSGAESAEDAVSVALDFLEGYSNCSDSTEYGMNVNTAQYAEANEYGEYEFPVVIANK